MSTPTHAPTVRYTIVPSPIGMLLVAAIGQEIVHLAFENHDFDKVITQLEARFQIPAERDDQALSSATSQLSQYFAGARTHFELPIRRAIPDGFVGRVQQQLENIPYGQTRTYGQLAADLEKPGAARAVGSACAKNPVPLFQPCHRVVRADGSPGEFSGTPGAKQYLLAFEAGENPEPPTPKI